MLHAKRPKSAFGLNCNCVTFWLLVMSWIVAGQQGTCAGGRGESELCEFRWICSTLPYSRSMSLNAFWETSVFSRLAQTGSFFIYLKRLIRLSSCFLIKEQSVLSLYYTLPSRHSLFVHEFISHCTFNKHLSKGPGLMSGTSLD